VLKHGYGHTVYRVISNPENLSTVELALIADRGSLCFGYRLENGNITIRED